MGRHSGILIFLFLSAIAGGPARAQPPSSPDFFEARIRPVLARNCFACHTKSEVAGLRLDSREAMLKGGQTGPAVVPGDPDRSLLIVAIRHNDPELKMPKGGKLKQPEIDDLTEWVKAGAVWPAAQAVKADSKGITREQREFWAFQPLKMPAVPQPKNKAWGKTAIDRFVLARLEAEGLSPVRPADRRNLIRRVTLDLTGLPPTPEEVDAFLADKSPDAYTRLVDRLLASPAYGERWGRFWLDVVRYGEDDTRGLAMNGRGHEPYANAFRYRDWVIQAMNDDLPFDVFVKAQLAADQFEDNRMRVRHLPALGFLGQGPWYYDLTEPPVARADERHERVDTLTRGFLGLTIGCARCHDHKYDPVSARDYYALAGVFNSSQYHEHPLAPKKVVEEWKALEKKLKAQAELLNEFQNTASAQLAEVHARRAKEYMMAAWSVTTANKERDKVPSARAAAEAKLDHELLDRWVKFLAKPPAFYPFLKDWQAMIQRNGSKEEAEKLAQQFQDLLMSVMAEKKEIKKKNERMLATIPDPEEVKSIPLPNGFKSFFDQHQLELKSMSRERMNLYIDVFQYQMSDEPMQPGRRFEPGLLVFRGWGLERQLSPEWNAHMAALRADMEALRKKMPEQFPFVHGVTDLEKPEDLKLHVRGSPYSLGEVVPRGFPAILAGTDEPAPFSKGSGRMELAERIVAHPITARVIVNRVWRGHFGTGIVDTPSNFGMAGERPSHPELLEYLAAWFDTNGRSLKKLHREIVLSETYQLSTESNAAGEAKDPANRLYWRANRHRMDAEQIRDAILMSSGALDPKMFGPSAELTDDFKRRTVYGKVSRFKLDTYLQMFDFPNPNISAEKRYSTNVPLQRLFFLNSPFVYKQAEILAKKLAPEPSDETRIRRAYRILYQREPSPPEIEAGLAFIAAEKAALREPKKEVSKQEKGEDAALAASSLPSSAAGLTAKPEPAASASAEDAKPKPEGASQAESKADAVSSETGNANGGEDRKPDADAPREATQSKEKKKPFQPNPWAQYIRVLFSASEFTFIN